MKKFVLSAFLFPATVFVGWVANQLAESFERSLDQLEFDFEDE